MCIISRLQPPHNLLPRNILLQRNTQLLGTRIGASFLWHLVYLILDDVVAIVFLEDLNGVAVDC